MKIELPSKLNKIFDSYRYKVMYGGRGSGNVGIGMSTPTSGVLVLRTNLAGVPDLEILSTTAGDSYGSGIRAAGGFNSSILRLMSSTGQVHLHDSASNYEFRVYDTDTIGVQFMGSGANYVDSGNLGTAVRSRRSTRRTRCTAKSARSSTWPF